MNNNNPPYVPSAAVGLGGSGYTIDSGLRSVGGGSSAVERTMLVQFSIRRGQESTIRYRLFLPGETRTFTPDFWDGQRSWNLTGSYTTHTTLDRIVYRGSHNSGSGISNYFDNVYIYKAIPVCSYSSKLNGTAKVINDAVIGHTMTILDPSSDDITVISKGWYDLSTEPPSLITDDFEYTIPNSMLGKKIKAEITVDNNGVVTTYEPFIGYVRAPIDYTRLLSQMSQSDKTYTQWEDWTNQEQGNRA